MDQLLLNLGAKLGFHEALLPRNNTIVFLLILLPSTCFAQGLSRYTFTHNQMGTQFRLILYAESETKANQLAHQAFANLDELNQRLSDYLPESELNLLCKRAGERAKIPVSQDLSQVLWISKDIARKSGGAFDVSIGPLSHTWRKAFRQSVFPTEMVLAKAQEKVNYKWIKINRKKAAVKLQKDGMQLDLGGIAKGYAADKMADLLKDAGCAQFLIDAGGDLLLGAPPPERKGWRVATAQIDVPPEILSHCAVATSGDTYRFLEHEGKRYSHIIDPRTGYGLIDQKQVTVIAPNATLADALASALSVLGEQEGMKLLRRYKGSSASFQEPASK